MIGTLRSRQQFPRVSDRSFSNYESRYGIERGPSTSGRTITVDNPYDRPNTRIPRGEVTSRTPGQSRSSSGFSSRDLGTVSGTNSTRASSDLSRTSGVAGRSSATTRTGTANRSGSTISAGAGNRGGFTERSGSTSGSGTGNPGLTTGTASRGFAERGTSSSASVNGSPISGQARYGTGTYDATPNTQRAGISQTTRIDGNTLERGIVDRGAQSNPGNGGNGSPYPVDNHNHRRNFFGHNNSWSFFAGFNFGHSFFSPWFFGYTPFFTYYQWYPYFHYGRSYYYADYPYYCSPSNNYYYDEYYPVYNYYGDSGGGGSYTGGVGVEGNPAYGVEEEEPSSETLVDFYLRLGDVHFKRGEYVEAVEAFKKAAQEDPGAAVPKFALGEGLFATGDYHYSAYNIRKGLEIDESWVQQTIDRRELYGNPTEFDRHLASIQAYIGEHPYDTAAHFVYGYNAFFSADYDTALAAFQRVQEIEPGERFSTLFLNEIPVRRAAAAEAKPETEEKK